MAATLCDAWNARFATDPPDLDASDEARLLQMANRRSIRTFADRPIPSGLLHAILMATQSAPSKSDLQQYSIVVLRDSSVKQQLASIAGGTPWIATAPIILVFLGDLRRMRRICTYHGRNYANGNLDSFMNAAVDAGIALATCIQAAESQGLGTCPLSIIRNRIDETADLLNLPDQVFPIAALGLGYALEKGEVSLRLPSEILVHDGAYDDSNLLSALENYDSIRRDRQPIPDDKQRHVDRFGIDENMTWSANAARQMAVPERAGFKAWLTSRNLPTD